jgi:hypothetical protein
MRITYRTLAAILFKMSNDQLDSDVTVELPTEFGSECFAAELRIAGESHDGGLDDGHPVIFVHTLGEAGERRDDLTQIAVDIGVGS